MGYSHSFILNEELTEKVVAEIKQVLDKYNFIKYEYDDQRSYVATTEEIRFNGFGEAGYETFSLVPDKESFCKTNYKEYDIAVCQILLVLKKNYGDAFELSSDGFWVGLENFEKDEFDGYWNDAFSEVEKDFGYKFGIEKITSSEGSYTYYHYKVS